MPQRSRGEHPCAVDGCGRSVRASGWCSTHYQRWWKTGSTECQELSARDRFWAKIKYTPEGCWEFQSARDPEGYRTLSVGGRTRRAHRVAYELLVGPIPEGLTLDHLCRNTGCVNPDHLEPVTHRVNILRGRGLAAQNAAKTHCIHGHPLSIENTYVSARGQRQCRTCNLRRAAQRRFRAEVPA